MTPDGTPTSDVPLEVSTLTEDLTVGVLKPVDDGYLAAWVEPTAGRHAIKMLALDASGKAIGSTSVVAQLADDVRSLDILPNAKGALLLWELTRKDAVRSDRSDLVVLPTAAGKASGPAETVARDVIGWEPEATARGAAIAMVVPASGSTTSNAHDRPKGHRVVEPPPEIRASRTGKVVMIELDATGKAGPPVVVSAEPTAELDVMLAEVNGVYLLAWTDERDLDSSVFVAAVEPGVRSSARPSSATPPFGEQALVGLVAAPYAPGMPRSKRALLAWEHQLNAQPEGRTIHLATLGPDGRLGPDRGSLTFAASGPPDIEPDGNGFAALTLAPAKRSPPASGEEDAKGDAPVWPAFVRFAADLSIVAAGPIRAKPFSGSDGFRTRRAT